MMKLSTTTQFFTPENAREIVAQLNSDEEDDWTYTVKVAEKIEGPYPAVIELYDEDGEFVTLWTAG